MISDQKTVHRVPYRTSCRALGVSEAWFYTWRRRPFQPTQREIRRVGLAERVRCFFDYSGQTYGSPRITLDLCEEGWQVSQNTVADIMAELGLQGRTPPRRRRSLTRPGKRKAAPALVRRTFDAVAPDVLWWGGMTQIDTGVSPRISQAERPKRPLTMGGHAAGIEIPGDEHGCHWGSVPAQPLCGALAPPWGQGPPALWNGPVR
ncbi:MULTISPECIES: IS3 family transposase [Streptomyces violaceusniger group]|uniref:IS3 family transposase n=1 Tax=Streptomyces violaceusniger group TaxID=2839105 RepID=UPI001BAA20AF|nr:MULTISPECIES: IS3 family transposase [Streptomyces violaceusniger group]